MDGDLDGRGHRQGDWRTARDCRECHGRGPLAAPQGLCQRRVPVGLLRPITSALSQVVLDGGLRQQDEAARMAYQTRGWVTARDYRSQPICKAAASVSSTASTPSGMLAWRLPWPKGNPPSTGT